MNEWIIGAAVLLFLVLLQLSHIKKEGRRLKEKDRNERWWKRQEEESLKREESEKAVAIKRKREWEEFSKIKILLPYDSPNAYPTFTVICHLDRIKLRSNKTFGTRIQYESRTHVPPEDTIFDYYVVQMPPNHREFEEVAKIDVKQIVFSSWVTANKFRLTENVGFSGLLDRAKRERMETAQISSPGIGFPLGNEYRFSELSLADFGPIYYYRKKLVYVTKKGLELLTDEEIITNVKYAVVMEMEQNALKEKQRVVNEFENKSN